MWETIKDVLTSGNAWFVLIFLVVVIVIGLILGRIGLIKFNTKHVQIGNELTQRELVRRQVETAYTFVMSLEGKIITEGSSYDRYLTKYILELQPRGGRKKKTRFLSGAGFVYERGAG